MKAILKRCFLAWLFQAFICGNAFAIKLTEGQVIGTWKYATTDGENKRTLEFLADHTFKEHALLAYAYAVTAGTWRISNGKIWVKGNMDSAVMRESNLQAFEAAYELVNENTLKWAKGGYFIIYQKAN